MIRNLSSIVIIIVAISIVYPFSKEFLSIANIIITVIIAYIAHNISKRQLNFQYREEYKKVYYKLKRAIEIASIDDDVENNYHSLFHEAYLDAKILTKDIEEYALSLYKKSTKASRLQQKVKTNSTNHNELQAAMGDIIKENPDDLFRKYLKLD